MSPEEALVQFQTALASAARTCAREVFAAGVDLQQRISEPSPALFEEVWSFSSDRLLTEVEEMLTGAGLTSDETVTHLQFVALEEFDGEFDRLNEAWMGEGGRA